jgi:hypothetical protein
MAMPDASPSPPPPPPHVPRLVRRRRSRRRKHDIAAGRVLRAMWRVYTPYLAGPASGASPGDLMADAAGRVLAVPASGASPGDLMADAAARSGYAFVCKNCCCLDCVVPPNATAAQVAVAAYAGVAAPSSEGASWRQPARAWWWRST